MTHGRDHLIVFGRKLNSLNVQINAPNNASRRSLAAGAGTLLLLLLYLLLDQVEGALDCSLKEGGLASGGRDQDDLPGFL